MIQQPDPFTLLLHPKTMEYQSINEARKTKVGRYGMHAINPFTPSGLPTLYPPPRTRPFSPRPPEAIIA